MEKILDDWEHKDKTKENVKMNVETIVKYTCKNKYKEINVETIANVKINARTNVFLDYISKIVSGSWKFYNESRQVKHAFDGKSHLTFRNRLEFYLDDPKTGTYHFWKCFLKTLKFTHIQNVKG